MFSYIFGNSSFESLFTQIGVEILGPIRGVLPTGPRTVGQVPLPYKTLTSILSYNYTLENQGIDYEVTCNYTSQSPVIISGIPGDTNSNPVLQYSGTCDGPGEADILNASQPFTVLNSNSTLDVLGVQIHAE